MSNKTPQEGFTNGGQVPAYGNEKTWQQLLDEKEAAIASLKAENEALKKNAFDSVFEWEKEARAQQRYILELQDRIRALDLAAAAPPQTDINAGDIPTPSKGQETKEEGERQYNIYINQDIFQSSHKYISGLQIKLMAGAAIDSGLWLIDWPDPDKEINDGEIVDLADPKYNSRARFFTGSKQTTQGCDK